MTRGRTPARGTVRRRVTDNGFTILTEQVPGVLSVTLGFWVTVGSRDESPEELGLSHFLEHMIFKGTATRTARDIAETMDAIGGQLDAFTSQEQTCFFSQVLGPDVTTAVEILSDIVLHSSFAPEEIDRERQVVLEEIKMVEDDPEESVNEAAVASMWGDHPLGRSILGTAEAVRGFSRDDFLRYFRRHYDGAGIAFVASGAVDHDELAGAIVDSFGGLHTGGERRQRALPAFRAGRRIVTRDTQQVHLVMAFPTVPYAHPDRYPLFVLNAILGATMSSRLFQEVREKRGWAYNIYSTPVLYADAGAELVYAAVSPENLAGCLDVVCGELASLATQPPAGAELAKAKGHLKGTTALGMEKTATRMMTLARQELYYQKTFSLDEVLAAIDAVTAEDVTRVAAQTFATASGNLTLLGPVPADLGGCAGRYFP